MKSLDSYFEKARAQKEIVPLAEIDKMLSLKHEHTRIRSTNSIYAFARRKQFRLGVSACLTIVAVCTLAVLVYENRTHAEEEVFIPQAQRRVMHLVKNISDRPQNPEITVSQFGADASPEGTTIPIHLRSKFALSEEKLKLLGITFHQDYIEYEGNVKGKGYLAFRILRTGAKALRNFSPLELSDGPRPGIKEYEFYPWFMTDEAGYQGFLYRFANEPALKMTNSFFLSAIDELIPIQIDRPGFEKVIFWFSQTPQLMNILEAAAMVSKGPQNSHDINTDQTKRTIQIEIFPTITKGHVQVVVNVLKKQKLEISLLNSSGEVLQVPVNNQTLQEGDYDFLLDLSTFRKGLYFIRIKSAPGVTTVHRLFKE